MRGPCYPVVFNNKSPWQQTHQTQKHRGALRPDLTQRSKTCDGSIFVSAQVISRSACPGLQWCVVGPDCQIWKPKGPEPGKQPYIIHCLPDSLASGGLQLLPTQCPNALCGLSLWMISGGFQERLWAYILWQWTEEPGGLQSMRRVGYDWAHSWPIH